MNEKQEKGRNSLLQQVCLHGLLLLFWFYGKLCQGSERKENRMYQIDENHMKEFENYLFCQEKQSKTIRKYLSDLDKCKKI